MAKTKKMSDIFKGVDLEVFPLTDYTVKLLIDSGVAHSQKKCWGARNSTQPLKYVNLGKVDAAACNQCLFSYHIKGPEYTPPRLVAIADVLKELSKLSRVRSEDFTELRHPLRFISEVNEHRQKRSYETRPYFQDATEAHAQPLLAKVEKTYQESLDLLRGRFHEDLCRSIVKPLVRVSIPDEDAFPEAHKAAVEFRDEQTRRLVEDQTLKLVKTRYYWANTRAIEAVKPLYGEGINDVLLLPAAIAAFFAAKDGADVASIPPGVQGAELDALVETVGVLYRPDDSDGAYSSLKDAVAAAHAL